MATIAVGDIHGNLPALKDVLAQLCRVVVEGDVVVFLGDYIDRGRDSRACVDAMRILYAVEALFSEFGLQMHACRTKSNRGSP